ncbi:uncharacterized protein LY79DRAFT_239397 [Colletotrichum navitas]|uniref:Uncharacterized protein n=1 Tax=Colletotrichum navitas TaxID=681940 RepID=A0AAD8PY88_9PEZI|nr:uncharacterized protein LY79DRAFT_239397 [Colletotrichum navitas]KAK1589735.1 hypothetical protein LY79DRAFT_239397 [Colletotrichum navitas]
MPVHPEEGPAPFDSLWVPDLPLFTLSSTLAWPGWLDWEGGAGVTYSSCNTEYRRWLCTSCSCSLSTNDVRHTRTHAYTISASPLSHPAPRESPPGPVRYKKPPNAISSGEMGCESKVREVGVGLAIGTNHAQHLLAGFANETGAGAKKEEQEARKKACSDKGDDLKPNPNQRHPAACASFFFFFCRPIHLGLPVHPLGSLSPRRASAGCH